MKLRIIRTFLTLSTPRKLGLLAVVAGLLSTIDCESRQAAAADPARLKVLEPAFAGDVQPLLKKYCHECHAGERVEAELDLAAFRNFALVRKSPLVWQKVGE
ncbi:MAG TPA: hypothetical protein VL096_09880, partial [Pirellulaceae bacterium]|nr:hypothetical protein [Pirellulaceae bacterium]